MLKTFLECFDQKNILNLNKDLKESFKRFQVANLKKYKHILNIILKIMDLENLRLDVSVHTTKINLINSLNFELLDELDNLKEEVKLSEKKTSNSIIEVSESYKRSIQDLRQETEEELKKSEKLQTKTSRMLMRE